MRQKLSELAVKNVKAPATARKIAGANDLYLHVEPTAAKYWRYRYRTPEGRERVSALGVYPLMMPANARVAHADARKALASGVHSVQRRRDEEADNCASAACTFEVRAQARPEAKRNKWTQRCRPNASFESLRRHDRNLSHHFARDFSRVREPCFVARLCFTARVDRSDWKVETS
jgi:hypothetical protein